jgi:hypothetical protein
MAGSNMSKLKISESNPLQLDDELIAVATAIAEQWVWRITACVNACEDIENDTLMARGKLSDVITMQKDRANKLTKQRD